MSHSSEHLEGVPSVPSRLNPSKFAPSPTSSPNRNLPQNVYSQPAPMQTPYPPEGSTHQIGGHNVGQSQYPQMQSEQPHTAWGGHQSPQSPFMGRTSSFGGWVADSQHQGPPNWVQGSHNSDHDLPNLRQIQAPNDQLELIPETSEHMSNSYLYSDTPRLSGHISGHDSAAHGSAAQPFLPQPDQQTNGNAHAMDWHYHNDIDKAYLPT